MGIKVIGKDGNLYQDFIEKKPKEFGRDMQRPPVDDTRAVVGKAIVGISVVAQE